MVFNPNAPAGNWFTPAQTSNDPRGLTPQDRIDDDTRYWTAWMNSPMGQKWNQAQEEAARRAREQADFEMAHKKRELDARVEELRMQGRRQEADLLLRQGDAQLARERFAWEREIKQQELSLQRDQFGLQRAETQARYMQSPDQMFMLRDLQRGLARAGLGLGPQPYGANDMPRMKTAADFDAIAGPSGSLAGGGGGGMAGGAPGQQGQGGGGTDPRIAASNAVMKAIPPSDGAGTDDNDAAALSAIYNIFKARKPGTLERMRPGQQAAFGAGLARLGFYAPDAIADMRRSGVGQGRAGAA